MTQPELIAIALILYRDGYHKGLALDLATFLSSVYPDLDYARFLEVCGLEKQSKHVKKYKKDIFAGDRTWQ